MLSTLNVSLVKSVSLHLDISIDHIWSRAQLLCALFQQRQRLQCLLRKGHILRKLVQAVYKLHKVVFKERKVVQNRKLERIKRTLHQMLLRVLSSQRKNVDDHSPARFDVVGLGHAHVGDAHDDELFDLEFGVQIVQHDCLERFQEFFLEVVVAEFFFEKEFVSQLSERVDGEDGDVKV